MKTHKVLTFYGVTFALCWLIASIFFLFPEPMEAVFGPMSLTNPVFILYAWMPTLVAISLSAIIGGRAGIQELFARCLRWRTGLIWYLLIFLGIPALAFAAAFLSGLPIQPDFQPVISMIAVYILMGPLSEEPGWHGYALPHLLEKSNALKAGLITGVLWAIWHLPAYIISGTPQEAANPFQAFLGFILIAIGMNLLQAWVFIRAKGSTLVAGILFHLSYNISMTLSGDPHLWLGILFLLAAVIVFAIPQNRSFIGRLEPVSN